MFTPYEVYTEETLKDIHLPSSELVGNEFHDCTFQKCQFVETTFRHCQFVNCIFDECDFSMAKIPNCVFVSAQFKQSVLIGIDWTQAAWSGVDQSLLSVDEPPKFEACVLNHSTFIGLDLTELQCKDCQALDVDFREANLSKANFDGTDLTQAIFQKTNLSHTDFSRARNYHIQPQKNTIKNAKFAIPEAIALLYGLDIVMVEA